MFKMSFCYFCSFATIMQIIYSFVQISESMQESQSREHVVNAATSFIKVGEDITIECNFCNIDGLQWTYKGPNRSQEEIATKNKIIRKKHQGKNFSWFELINNSTCQYSLYLPKIQYGSAGLYCCWENMIKKVIANIVVISDTLKCSSEPEFLNSNHILLKQDPFTIKCSFEYLADEYCIVTPIWTDLKGYRNLMIPANDIEANMDDKHTWIHFKPGADIRNGTRFNFSLAFNCSSLNDSDTIRSGLEGRHDFGQIPFTLFTEVKNVLGRREIDVNSLRFIVTLSSCTVLVMFLSALAVFLMCLKNYSKLCFANRANKETIELGNDPSEKPKSGEYIGLREDRRTSISNVYDVINEETYETIDDPEKPVEI